ncbi:hypothetical protein MFIFM68171_02335 [Madurella fahalii]|uniref:Uncharacterized protein n=1 Tax=Madurella fahalii TaxID=1157608 RepID=A0ABQ0G2Y9_9PEZI
MFPPAEQSRSVPVSILKHVEKRESLESQARGKTPTSFRAEAATEQKSRKPARSRAIDTSVRAHSIIITTFPPELTAIQEGLASPATPMTSVFPSPLRRVHSQGSLRQSPAYSEDIPDVPTRWPMRPNLLRKQPSLTDSVSSSGSEPILSDAVAVHTPLLQLATQLSEYLQCMGAGAGAITRPSGSDDHSSESTYGLETADATQQTGTWLPQFAFSMSRSSPSQPLGYLPQPAASATSLESLLPKEEASCSFRIIPIMTIADVRPCPPVLGRKATLRLLPSTPTTTPEVNATSSLHGPTHDCPERCPRPTSSIASFRTLERFLQNHGPEEATTKPTNACGDQQPFGENTNANTSGTLPSGTHARPFTHSASHQELIRKYEDLSQQRERELAVLAERVERLESNNDRWLNAIVPVFERILASRGSGSRLERGSDNANMTAGLFRAGVWEKL